MSAADCAAASAFAPPEDRPLVDLALTASHETVPSGTVVHVRERDADRLDGLPCVPGDRIHCPSPAPPW